MAGEKLFENRVKRYFETMGIYPAGCPEDKINAPPIGWYFKVWGGGFQKSGIPDIIANVNGVFVAIELKADAGRASELQKLNISRINQSNGIGVILWPSGFDDFKKLIEEVIQCNIAIPALISLKNARSGTKCAILTEYKPFHQQSQTTP